MTDKMVKIIRMIHLATIAVLVIIICVSILNHPPRRKTIETPIPGSRVKEVSYREPIIKLPFQKNKQPVKQEDLPIPKEKVSKSISIALTGVEKNKSIKFDLVVDKKGHLYETKNVPKNVVIKTTIWKQKFISPGFRFGYTIAFSGGFYHCLSLDYLRIWKIYLGSEIGLKIGEGVLNELLIGLSLKYRFASLVFEGGSPIDVSLTTGFNFINYLPYGGLNVRW